MTNDIYVVPSSEGWAVETAVPCRITISGRPRQATPV